MNRINLRNKHANIAKFIYDRAGIAGGYGIHGLINKWWGKLVSDIEINKTGSQLHKTPKSQCNIFINSGKIFLMNRQKILQKGHSDEQNYLKLRIFFFFQKKKF